MAGLGKTLLWANPLTMPIMAGRKFWGLDKQKASPLAALPELDDSQDRLADERRKKYQAQRAKAFGAGGRRGTLLTGGMGLTTDFQTERKTLLGS